MDRWERGEEDIVFADMPYPEKLWRYVEDSFLQLKATQYQIMGHDFPLVEAAILPNRFAAAPGEPIFGAE